MTAWSLPAIAEPHMRPRRGANAGSMLRTVMGEYMVAEGRWTWTQTLVRALELFGFDGATTRQALLRTTREEWLESKRDGRRVKWRLSKAGWRATIEAHERVNHFESGRADWNGKWLLLVVATPDDRSRVLIRRRLGWAGFAVLPSGQAMISPHVEREEEARRMLELLGLRKHAVSFTAVTGAIGLPKQMIAGAWDLGDLERRYRAFVGQMKALRPRSERDVFVAYTRLIHEWRRFPYLDPGLPLEFLPPGWIGREAKLVFDDRRARWRERALDWFQVFDEDNR
jgi:phenylacetic acid degradation operon negative regulatory protein